MMKSKFIILVMLVFATTTNILANSSATSNNLVAAVNDSVVSDDDLEAWLEEMSVSITEISPEVEPVNEPVVEPVVSLEVTPTTTTTTTTKKSKIAAYKAIKPSEMISERDSIDLRKEAILESLYNPLFLDWVFGGGEGVSNNLVQDDSVVVAIRSQVREYVRATNPELYSYHISELPEFKDIEGKEKKGNKEKMMIDMNKEKLDKAEIETNIPKASMWTRGAQFQLQGAQNYISSNWYNGGESTLAGNLYVMGYYNYNNTEKNIQWENKAEWRLGVNSTNGDSLRDYRVNDDLFHINSKFGLKAFDKMYYTAEVDVEAQLFNTYTSNTNIRTTGTLSPIRTNISLGLDYKVIDGLSIFLSPVSYKLIYVMDTTYADGVLASENIPNQVGITDGTQMLNQIGGLLRVNWTKKFNDYINTEVKFSFFGNYVGATKGVEIDCEMIANFQINRFFSSKISIYPRYDTTVATVDGSPAKIQFYEFVSIGFSYTL